MSRQDDIRLLLKTAQGQLNELQSRYRQSLSAKKIDAEIPVLIKNYLENLRSALDYFASDIAEVVLKLSPSARPYFPIACHSAAEYRSRIQGHLPGLDTVSPALFKALEDIQPYRPTGLKALPTLSKLVNENKHRQLSPQQKTESRSLRIDFPGNAGIRIGRGASIEGGGVISSGGGAVSAGTGSISGESPAELARNVKQTVQVWVSFEFARTGDEVLGLLRSCLDEVKQVTNRLGSLLYL